jgi:rubrerythrin
MHALTILSGEQQTHNYYMNIGPIFADPVARQLYAEIASVEEQHVTQYESIIDPTETWLEKWLLHEANEVYNYYGFVQQETNARIKAIWERMLDYELGHLNIAMELVQRIENRDPAELLPREVPEPIPFEQQREFVRKVLANEVDLRDLGAQIVPKSQEGHASLDYRAQMNSAGSPSQAVSAGYRWRPGTELNPKVVNFEEAKPWQRKRNRKQSHRHPDVAQGQQGNDRSGSERDANVRRRSYEPGAAAQQLHRMGAAHRARRVQRARRPGEALPIGAGGRGRAPDADPRLGAGADDGRGECHAGLIEAASCTKRSGSRSRYACSETT